MYNEQNFFTCTHAKWKACKMPHRKPDYVSYGSDGKVSSAYWYYDKRVVRWSNHWSAVFTGKPFGKVPLIECGRVASCRWTLKVPKAETLKPAMCGSCAWDAFEDVRFHFVKKQMASNR